MYGPTTPELWDNMVREVVRLLLRPKPRLICICNEFDLGERDPVVPDWFKCKNCGGWMSRERMVDMGLI